MLRFVRFGLTSIRHLSLIQLILNIKLGLCCVLSTDNFLYRINIV